MTRIVNLAILSLLTALAGCGGNNAASESPPAVAAAVTAASAPAPTVTLATMVRHSASAPMQGTGGGAAETVGELLVLQEDDFKANTGRTRHFLKTSDGRVELNFAGKTPDLHTGMKLRVRGAKSGTILTPDSTAVEDQGGGAAAALTNTLGERKTLVLLVNFQDNTSQPYTLSEATGIVYSQANNFFKENSQQQTWLSGAAYGWYTLPLSQASCDVFQIEAAAKQAATNAGVNVASYNHYVYVFPNTTACPWGGLGTIGGNPGSVWINGNLRVASISHELGHNLGLQHSHGLECGAASVGTNCTNVDYGDLLDAMGSTNPGHFNAFQKEKLGWLNSGSLPPITTVQGSGTFTLSAYEAAGTSAKALKILKSTDPTTGAKTWYYVEYRTATGSDSFIATINGTNVQNGVVVHTGTEGGGSSLLDMTPASSIYYTYDWNDPALPVGQSYTDASAGVVITTNAVNGSSATVTVSLGAPSTDCGRASPVITAAPQTLSASAGTVLTYTLTVTNKDNAACGSSNFVMQATPVAGWSENFGTGSLSIAPGASASTTLAVGSPATASGNTLIVVTATNSAAPSSVGSTGVSYQAQSGLQVGVITDKPTYLAGQTVSMSANVKSGSAPVSGAKVTFAINQPNGAVVTQSATTNASGVASISYRLGRKNVGGTYRVNAAATGGTSSAAGTVDFSVQ
ncbi:MG2 domain-containing protein [Massilia sp. BJB1822]|uniref:MG2 domain-containing protein n=1 Tax=Massilia sp. BJB1822 TaxID=2744470 RepID=UPI001594B9B4|nr:MG2 domain-containing protein [Massilia sp. BJB1822]NVE00660.1 peptidase M11 [Massilia sp. BJB1822]